MIDKNFNSKHNKILNFTDEQLYFIKQNAKNYRAFSDENDIEKGSAVLLEDYIAYIIERANINILYKEIDLERTLDKDEETKKVVFYYSIHFSFRYVNISKKIIEEANRRKKKSEDKNIITISLDCLNYYNLLIAAELENIAEEELIIKYISIIKEYDVEEVNKNNKELIEDRKVYKIDLKFTDNEINKINNYINQYKVVHHKKRDRKPTIKEYLEYVIDEGIDELLIGNKADSFYKYRVGQEKYEREKGYSKRGLEINRKKN